MNDTDDPRERINQKYDAIQQSNYYEILGVDPSAKKSEIRAQFRELAQTWHADRFNDQDLDEESREKLQAIFSAINNAHQTLSDPESRQSYDATLETEDTDIESVIDAEDSFRKGRNLLDAGRYEGAHEQFKEACRLSPEDEPEYRAHRLYTQFVRLPKHEDGTPKNEGKARRILEEMESIANDMEHEKAWLLAFMGRLSDALGRTNQARTRFKRAKRLDPDNHMAERHLRLLERRSQQNEDDGWFQSLLSKLNLN